MMKYSLILLTSISLVLAACGAPTKKNPVENYSTDGVPLGQGDNKNYQYIDKEIPVVKEVPVVQEKIVYVDREKLVYPDPETEQLFIRGQLFQVSNETKKSIKFLEGQKAEYNVVVEILQGTVGFDAQFDLSKMPGATVTHLKDKDAINKKTYKLSWTPAAGKVIESSANEKEDLFVVSLKNLKFLDADAKTKETIQKFFEAAEPVTEVPFVVRRPENAPTTIKVVGLEGNRKQGEVHPFKVEVNAPGTSDTLMPQVLAYPYLSNTNPITNSGVLMNGAFYVHPDATKPVENLGNGKWIFNYIYDTRGSLDQSAFNKELTDIQAGATKLQVSLIFTAVTPAPLNTSSDPIQLKFAIELSAPQPAASTTAAANVPAGTKMNTTGR